MNRSRQYHPILDSNAGRHCVFISAPPGWVIDAKPKFAPAAIYPAGYTLKEAFDQTGIIYLNFLEKGRELCDLMAATRFQDNYIKQTYPNAKIEYFDQESHKGHKCVLRIADIDKGYGGLEYSYFIDYESVVIFFVLLEDQKKCGEYLPKLRWVAQKHLIGQILFDSKALPMSVRNL